MCLTINCQSIYPKTDIFVVILNQNQPDLVFGCESWLSPAVHNAEISHLITTYTGTTEKMVMEVSS